MFHLKLFDDGTDDKVSIKTDNEYAKNYDKWRKKEELHKLQAKYGELESNSDSSSSSDDDDEEINSEFEKEFFKTLSYLKNKDPCIYNDKTTFFKNVSATFKASAKKDEIKPVYLKDYERKLILEKEDQFSDEEQPKVLTYAEEQEQIKNDLKVALDNVDQEEKEKHTEWGGLFTQRHKTKEEKIKEEEDYKQWLAGQKDHMKDSDFEHELKPLKDFWNNPALEDGEKFLRDYILNKRFLDTEDKDYIPTYEEIVHDSDEGLSEDEDVINKQEEFENKYNFRFEEPDQEFIKRYPRTMENSVRKKDDRRKIKRAELKERKEKEKQQKVEEIKHLKALKRKEIEEKIQMLKEITGNTDVGFNIDDIDGDFNPDEHDKRMQTLFNEQFYSGPEGDQKPEFPDIDKELDIEIENWDKWDGQVEDPNEDTEEMYEPHCEDEDFNMDCDYDPSKATQHTLIENSKSKKKRKRKSQFAKVVSQSKPVYNPDDKTFAEYVDEYYKLDCEDIIGEIPCRFKYRQVIPNSFGLTTEEIILANDKELNRWCSLKKAVQYRPEHVEKYDQIVYERKSKNENLKRKILPSLYAANSKEETEISKSIPSDFEKKDAVVSANTQKQSGDNDLNRVEKKKKRSEISNTSTEIEKIEIENNETPEIQQNVIGTLSENKKRRKRKRRHPNNLKEEPLRKKNKTKRNKTDVKIEPQEKISDARLVAYGLNPKKFKNKLKYKNKCTNKRLK